MSYDSPSTRLSLESVAVGCVIMMTMVIVMIILMLTMLIKLMMILMTMMLMMSMIDVVTAAGGGAGVEAPRDWQQIQNDQKCIFTFYKNTIRVARGVLSLLGHGHGHCTDGVLADNEED